MRDKKLLIIIENIYRDLYKETDPVGDWDNMVATKETEQEFFFTNYTIDKKRCDEIIEANFNKKRLADYEKQMIRNTIYLGCSPTFKEYE